MWTEQKPTNPSGNQWQMLMIYRLMRTWVLQLCGGMQEKATTHDWLNHEPLEQTSGNGPRQGHDQATKLTGWTEHAHGLTEHD